MLKTDSIPNRVEGLSLTVDKLRSFDRENFEIIAPMIDLVKIYSAFPLLISDSLLQRKIEFYHDHDIKVSTGSTLTEFAISEDAIDKFIEEIAKLGFDIIEFGENNIELDGDKKKRITELVLSANLSFHWKVGKKDPRHQLRIEDSIGNNCIYLTRNTHAEEILYPDNCNVDSIRIWLTIQLRNST